MPLTDSSGFLFCVFLHIIQNLFAFQGWKNCFYLPITYEEKIIWFYVYLFVFFFPIQVREFINILLTIEKMGGKTALKSAYGESINNFLESGAPNRLQNLRILKEVWKNMKSGVKKLLLFSNYIWRAVKRFRIFLKRDPQKWTSVYQLHMRKKSQDRAKNESFFTYKSEEKKFFQNRTPKSAIFIPIQVRDWLPVYSPVRVNINNQFQRRNILCLTHLRKISAKPSTFTISRRLNIEG